MGKLRGKDVSQIGIIIVLAVVAALCILPFLLLVSTSFTDNNTILREGYSLFPSKYSLFAYEYLMLNASSIFRAYGITILVTAVGTVVSLSIMALLAYPLSRKELPHRTGWTFFVFFTLLFNGGLVPTYMVYTQLINVKNTLFAYLLPFFLVKAFYVLLMRTFFMGIERSLIESAEIDGAGEWTIFLRIVIPLSYPVLATVGLFQAVAYWNDWFSGMIFITDGRLYSLQNLLNRILLDIQFLTTSTMVVATDEGANIPVASVRMALAVIGVVPMLVIYPFFQKYFVKGLTVGAVKG
ncbi:ABC transporter permease [Spirochaetia bacterium]|nr:ABC transporter permease [Spirochaetia bacterium]